MKIEKIIWTGVNIVAFIWCLPLLAFALFLLWDNSCTEKYSNEDRPT
jgi:hypothetical protein